jgi:hypothetical protein
VPRGERWIHEIKFDRYRVQLHIANEALALARFWSPKNFLLNARRWM